MAAVLGCRRAADGVPLSSEKDHLTARGARVTVEHAMRNPDFAEALRREN